MMDRLGVWRSMLRIRRLEEAVVRLSEDASRPIRGHVHVSIGQEATAVGASAALEPGDYVFTTHRNHGHVLARGGEPMRIVAEILGRQDGYSHGRAGGFHVAAPELGILHTSAIVGGAIPLAAGAAFAASRLGMGRASLVFFGDGAMEEGVFSETLNIAQLWKIPVILLMENNSVSPTERSGRGSPTSEHSAGALSDIPRAYGLDTRVIDGTDVEAVFETCRRARGKGPVFIESRTSRWPGNYASAPTLSVSGPTEISWAWTPDAPPEPVRAWCQRSDPVLRLAARLLDSDTASRETLLEIDDSVRAEITRAVDLALSSREPSPETALDYVVAPSA